MKGGKRRNVTGRQTRGESKKTAGKEAVRRNLNWLDLFGSGKAGLSLLRALFLKVLTGIFQKVRHALSPTHFFSFLSTETRIYLFEKSF